MCASPREERRVAEGRAKSSSTRPRPHATEGAALRRGGPDEPRNSTEAPTRCGTTRRGPPAGRPVPPKPRYAVRAAARARRFGLGGRRHLRQLDRFSLGGLAVERQGRRRGAGREAVVRRAAAGRPAIQPRGRRRHTAHGDGGSRASPASESVSPRDAAREQGREDRLAGQQQRTRWRTGSADQRGVLQRRTRGRCSASARNATTPQAIGLHGRHVQRRRRTRRRPTRATTNVAAICAPAIVAVTSMRCHDRARRTRSAPAPVTDAQQGASASPGPNDGRAAAGAQQVQTAPPPPPWNGRCTKAVAPAQHDRRQSPA